MALTVRFRHPQTVQTVQCRKLNAQRFVVQVRMRCYLVLDVKSNCRSRDGWVLSAATVSSLLVVGTVRLLRSQKATRPKGRRPKKHSSTKIK